MIDVTEAWKDIQQRFLLPETFVEIDCTISEVGAEEGATVEVSSKTDYSDAESIIDGTPKNARYATNELNLWALDGTRTILPSAAPYDSSGYVSDIATTGSVTLSFPAVHSVASSGLTITWSQLYGEYPTVFTVTARNGNTVVAETTVTDNRDRVSAVFLSIKDYDSITITVHDWCLPNRRARIEKVVIGHVLTLTKSDIISFKHEQHGDLLSGELPKCSIEFTLDNTDGRWNPNNPTGMEQYLSERQKLVVRYGMDVNGTVEWIKGGVFYLSEWDAPANGLEARFVARDLFEFLIGTDTTKLPNMSSTQYGPLSSIITWATAAALPNGVSVVVDDVLKNTAGRQFGADGTYAEMIQKCANAGCCVLRYDRDGTLWVEPLKKTQADYTIAQALSYSHPEVTLLKPLGQVIVDYGGDEPYALEVSPNGEKQTLTNDYILKSDAAESVATWVRDTLTSRKTVSGEFRADPRLDLFDVVKVESKYGPLESVVITNITYTYNGSFRGSYMGRVLEV